LQAILEKPPEEFQAWEVVLKRRQRNQMRKTVLFVFYLFSCQLLLAQNTLYVSSSSGLNLREGAGTRYKVVANMPNGSRLEVIETQRDWVKVSYKGQQGYISKEYVTENKPAANASSKRSSGNSGASAARNTSSGSMMKASSANNARNWGLGLRLGDPSGLTIKKYLSGGRAVEFNIGTTSYWGYDHRDHFYQEDKYADYEYISYRRAGAAALQVHYLFQNDIRDVANLQWYWGFGGQIRTKSYNYNYRYRNYYGPGQGDYVWIYASDKVTDFDLAADILIGLEYHIPGAPLSVFADANLMLELLDDPLALYAQAGIGVRYNFK
jgi:hypothetical protein